MRGVAGALAGTELATRALTRAVPGGALFYVDTARPVFSLTFDDGPHTAVTPALLDVLARHGAGATFFLIGERAAAAPELVARIAGEGHELANHLMRDEPSARLPDGAFRGQLAEVTALLAQHGPVRWFRPGSGWFTPRMLRTAADAGLGCALGTVAAMHRGRPQDRRIAPRLAGSIRPGTIAVLHEGTLARRGVVAATDAVLGELARRGLRSVTLSELVAGRR